MTTNDEALRALGEWAASDPYSRTSLREQEALRRAIGNLLAVTAGGAALPELVRLRAVWASSPGPATVIGTDERVSVEAAVWLNGVAAVATERDEGNRYSKGHPAAQTAPAVLALAQSLAISGPALWNALFVAYEIAARVGRATAFDPDVHTHGPLGAPGAAAGCAVLLGLDAAGISQAIDTGAAMAPATSWAAVFGGSAVRDQWVGQGALAGIAAARYVAAGLPGSAGGFDGAFSNTLGAIDLDRLIDGLGSETLVTSSYLKQHSSCAYTHGAADAALDLRTQLAQDGRSTDDIVLVHVDGTASAASLPATSWHSRHGAYFSVPFAVSSALLYGDVAADRSRTPAEPAHAQLASRVTVRDATAELRPETPTSRPARVTVTLDDGTRLSAAVRHPAGDAVETPFSPERLEELLDEALAPVGLHAAAVHNALTAFDDPAPDALGNGLSHLSPHLEGAIR
jgi:2-methylcitrate dehydratase PrpD